MPGRCQSTLIWKRTSLGILALVFFIAVKYQFKKQVLKIYPDMDYQGDSPVDAGKQESPLGKGCEKKRKIVLWEFAYICNLLSSSVHSS